MTKNYKDIILEVCGEEEYEESLAACKHKQCHAKYVPLNNFAYNDHPFRHERITEVARHYLPNVYNRKDVFDIVHVLYPLVVKVQASGKLCESASGRVVHVENRSISHRVGSTGQDGAVLVMTAWHIGKYCRNKEIRLTCILDYNDLNNVGKTMNVVKIYHYDEESDVCVLECQAPDANTADVLTKRVAAFDSLYYKLYDRMKQKKKTFHRWQTSEWTLSTLVIIISHPHGGPKLLSVGERVKRDPFGKKPVTSDLLYNYTAHTCLGCSGAPVLVFGSPTHSAVFVHRGKLKVDGTNCSSKACRLKKDKHGYCSCKGWASHS
ncbi:hypothetical protein Bpfe_026261 [Biomphalaria pfeifferi]|uniref:Uncharacterized protein n=1 Tax=Biomphalaria pfeifferi TaxID=112525 RepID=A0AAD8AXT3_BIOPF|nr:hypothetical protein Bpfe_026261 [Biomphalaria pfeifferi]